MEALELNGVTRQHRYVSQSISVDPNPPRVGEATTLALFLKNSGPKDITIRRVEFKVAQFGMGVGWEALPPIEQIHLPVDSNHVEKVAVQWRPTTGGHRCVQATIYSDALPQPLFSRCNLQVIESTAERRSWHIPFRLGNPENERMPVVLELGGNNSEEIDTHILVNGRSIRPGDPIWLNSKEEVDARLILWARTDAEIEAVKTVEASILGRFLDGIQVEVHRPAYVTRRPPIDNEPGIAAYEPVVVLAR